MSEYFQSEHLGKSKFIFWYGQVLGDWEGNENPEVHDRENIPGWGKRYKVLIFGQDPKFIKDGLSNDEAVMAEVILPTTAGSGIGGGTMTPNIGQNTYVMGFYKDGISGREPVILGLIPNVPQTPLFEYDKNNQTDRFNPATGYDPSKDWHLISNLKILSDGNGTSENIDPNINYVERHIQLQDGVKVDYIPKTYDCDKANGELKGIQNIIQNGLNGINKINSETNSFLNAATALPTSVSAIIDSVTGGVSSLVKGLVQKMRAYALSQFNSAIKVNVNLIPPNSRQNLRIASQTATDTISCVFNKITSVLFGLVKDAVNKIVGGVTAAFCSVTNVIGDVLSNILGDITSAIQGALSTVSGIIGKISNFAGNVLSALDIVANIFNLFSCQEQLKCPDIDEWSFWYGPKKMSDKVSEQISNVVSDIIGSGGSSESCSTAPQLCGPPNISILDSNGSGFLANPIISGSGSVLAFDIFDNGINYNLNPVVAFGDNCSTGNGAVILPIVNSSMGSVDDLIVLDTGVSYLPIPNGSSGAGSSKFSDPEDTIFFDGKSYFAIPPNKTIKVKSGDKLYLPPNTTVEIYDNDGNAGQILIGRGAITPVGVTTSGAITTPVPVITDQKPPQLNNSYPVALEIKQIYITNPGINYNDGDEIIITPDLGSKLIPEFDGAGRLINVNVNNAGIGFTEKPDIYIKSRSGINARMVPVFNVIRLTGAEEVLKDISIINVIDCIGRVYGK